MNWKTLYKSLLIVTGLFVLITIFLYLSYLSPWIMIGFVFITSTIYVYTLMNKYDNSDNNK